MEAAFEQEAQSKGDTAQEYPEERLVIVYQLNLQSMADQAANGISSLAVLCKKGGLFDEQKVSIKDVDHCKWRANSSVTLFTQLCAVICKQCRACRPRTLCCSAAQDYLL